MSDDDDDDYILIAMCRSFNRQKTVFQKARVLLNRSEPQN